MQHKYHFTFTRWILTHVDAPSKVPPDFNYWQIFEFEVAKSIYGAWRLHMLTAICWVTPQFTAARGFCSGVLPAHCTERISFEGVYASFILNHNMGKGKRAGHLGQKTLDNVLG